VSRLARLAARRGSLRSSARSLFYPADLVSGLPARRQLALPSSRATYWCMPCSRTPVVLPALALTRRKLLPSLIGDWVGFPTLPHVVIPVGPQHSAFRGSITRPASSLHPASHPPLLMMHAGSLLSCWLGFAQVGLAVNLTHRVALTSFLLAPPLVTGLLGATPTAVGGISQRFRGLTPPRPGL